MINSYVSKIIAEKNYKLVKVEPAILNSYGLSQNQPYYKLVDENGKIITHGTEITINSYFGCCYHS